MSVTETSPDKVSAPPRAPGRTPWMTELAGPLVSARLRPKPS